MTADTSRPAVRGRGLVPMGCPLTPGELEVIVASANGQTVAQHAHETGRSGSTIRTLRHTAYQRLGVAGAEQAFVVCWRNGWVALDGNAVIVAQPQPAAAEDLTAEQQLFAEAYDRWQSSRSEDDRVEVAVLLRILRRKGQRPVGARAQTPGRQA